MSLSFLDEQQHYLTPDQIKAMQGVACAEFAAQRAFEFKELYEDREARLALVEAYLAAAQREGADVGRCIEQALAACRKDRP